MVTQAIPQGRQRQVGRILTQVTITNEFDAVRAENGILPLSAVRTMTLDDVLVDTGATTLCLPADVVAQLGLPVAREVLLTTATGRVPVPLVEKVEVSVFARKAVVSCLVLPAGTPPLLGVLPLEALGVELDLQAQALRELPEGPEQTYWTAL